MGDIKLGLMVSVLFHAAVIYVASVGLPGLKRDFPTPPRPIPVELIDIEEFTRQKEPEKQAQPPEQKTSPAPARRLGQTRPDDAVPMPGATPKEKPDQELIKRRALTATVTPNTKPRPPSTFDTSKIAALIDRSIKETTPEADPAREKLLEEAVADSQVQDIDARVRTASYEDYIRGKMLGCWSVPAGALDAADMEVTLVFSLTPEGKIIGAPRIREQNRLFQPGNEYYKIFAESAARAIRLCEPYGNLPKQYYNEWKDWELIFSPREMLG